MRNTPTEDQTILKKVEYYFLLFEFKKKSNLSPILDSNKKS